MTDPSTIDGLLRELAPAVLARLLRSSSDFATSEDATQEALIAAAQHWPTTGVPANPGGWLVTAAKRRRIELWRNATARSAREQRLAALVDAGRPDDAATDGEDDTLQLMVLCCHPSISPTSQVALTLRAVGGLNTEQIAHALLVPTATVAQRISRAKAAIKRAGARFDSPDQDELDGRMNAVRHVLYLIFNEGYLSSSGDEATRPLLTGEAIRLARQLHQRRPSDGESAGLLALIMLTESRRSARTTSDGALVPLAEQDRRRWNHDLIDQGLAVLTPALLYADVGPFQLQAAIAALHAEAVTYEGTDWRQIHALYTHLALLAPGPIVTLNKIVAESMVFGPKRALHSLDNATDADEILDGHPRSLTVRAHLLEAAGRLGDAQRSYREAARACLNLPEQRHLLARANRVAARHEANHAGH